MSEGESASAMVLHKSKRKSVSFTAAKMRSTISAHKTNQEKKRGPMRRKTRCCTRAVGRSRNKSSLEKRERKMKMKAQVEEMEAFVSDMRTHVDSERRLLLEGEATVEAFKALVAQKREENKLQCVMILWGELLADHIQSNILP
ncbi:uncharacterized protein LOC110415369 isoform X2 [Herrania umbratica]|uniref:Uncharacterized protein LOC110415369 isoform X2 n=1 Tax=Herrania umbratica TaxID=108875 RepID=A0A6J1A7I3_9ROSI|nr:uncharacterized protein LOC110415369 isoform X2 [Herrania umbratica]